MRYGALVLCLALSLPAQSPPPAERKATLAGKVLNSATGEPVRKARLSLTNLTGAAMDEQKSSGRTALTDVAGNFEFADLEPGGYSIVASRDGFAAPQFHGEPKPLKVTMSPGERKGDLIMRLSPLGVITGRIMDADGDPIRNIEVQAMVYVYTANGRQLSEQGSAYSNDMGEYRIYDLVSGSYYIRAGSTGTLSVGLHGKESFAAAYYPGTPEQDAAAAVEVNPGRQAEGIDFVLHAMHVARIRGRVMNPGSNLTVGLTKAVNGGWSATTTTIDDPTGKFELKGVLPGSYTLVARSEANRQHLSAHLPILVGSADMEGIELHLFPPQEIAGQMRIEGKTAAKMSQLKVVLNGEGSGVTSVAGGESKSDGMFVLENLEPEVYQLSVNAPADLYLKAARWSDRDVLESGLDLTEGTAGGGLVVVLSANGGEIDGSVQNEQFAPAADAVVALIPTELRRKIPLVQTVRTSAAGKFHLRAVAPGSYNMYAFDDADPNRLMYDPDFLKPFESKGQGIEITEGSQQSVQLTVIAIAGEKPPG